METISAASRAAPPARATDRFTIWTAAGPISDMQSSQRLIPRQWAIASNRSDGPVTAGGTGYAPGDSEMLTPYQTSGIDKRYAPGRHPRAPGQLPPAAEAFGVPAGCP